MDFELLFDLAKCQKYIIGIDIQSAKTEGDLREFYGFIQTSKEDLKHISSYVELQAGYINEPPVSRLWN